MLKSIFVYPSVIGIAGAARSGKDTLCRGLCRVLSKNGYNGLRRSIAGDTVKKDLKDLIYNKTQIDSFTEDLKTKELIRPLLVEYGNLMRAKTEGRYFIDQFKIEKDIINIIPDIRYAEYQKDELYWIKNEVKGFLIFIERDGIPDINERERVNNKIIREVADYKLQWKSLDENTFEGKTSIDQFAQEIFDYMSTTYQEGKTMLSNMLLRL
jgi:Holliday junction resolvase